MLGVADHVNTPLNRAQLIISSAAEERRSRPGRQSLQRPPEPPRELAVLFGKPHSPTLSHRALGQAEDSSGQSPFSQREIHFHLLSKNKREQDLAQTNVLE